MNKYYCFNCRKKVAYTITEKELFSTFNKITISFIGKEVTCNNCDRVISIREITNENIRRANNKYRDVLGIIKVEEIENLLTIYNIGYKPLAVLLGWSEATISRYLKGLMPSKEYSDILKKIKNPVEMRKIYNSNKNNITGVAQRKLEKNIKKQLTYSDENTILILNYLFDKISNEYEYGIKLSKINKLMYLFIAWELAFLDRTIVSDELEISLSGPILKNLTENMIKNGYTEESYIQKNMFLNDKTTSISDIDIKIINFVWSKYGKYENEYLKQIFYSYDKAFKETLINKEKRINKDKIKDFYKSVKKRGNIVLEQDENLHENSMMLL